MKFKPLVPCPGPTGEKGCPDSCKIDATFKPTCRRCWLREPLRRNGGRR